MIKTARTEALIAEHAQLRKHAFAAVMPQVQAMFIDAEAGLRSCKTAAETSGFNPHLLRHLTHR